MDRYFQIKRKILEYSESDDDIKAIVAIGSSTRSDVKADEYSDIGRHYYRAKLSCQDEEITNGRIMIFLNR